MQDKKKQLYCSSQILIITVIEQTLKKQIKSISKIKFSDYYSFLNFIIGTDDFFLIIDHLLTEY